MIEVKKMRGREIKRRNEMAERKKKDGIMENMNGEGELKC